MKPVFALMISMLAMVTTTSFAHDTWIVCDPAVVPAGRALSVRITSGEKFPTLAVAPDADRIAKAEWRIGSRTGTIDTFKPEANCLVASGRVSTDGVGVIIVEFKPKEIELTPDQVTAYFDEIGAAEGVRKAYEQDGASAGFTETYTKHAKSYVRIGVGGDASGALGPVGFSIDFLPDSDPTALKVGDTLAIKVIRGGDELESSPIRVVCGATGQSTVLRTNKAGMVVVDVAAPGWWLVSATQIRRESAGTWESDFTTMTFHVEK